ncbi:peptidylprolyl isomerase [Prolixibacteraceae bacterium JC049]|nr:peptidylprolyl isomerase [Prolixibacteraceae bacterium JC049]
MRTLFFILFCCVASSVMAQERIIAIHTEFGTMKFRLYNDTPKHRDMFIDLAEDKEYDGTLFYRVIQNFMIQGGSRDSKKASRDRRIGYGNSDYMISDEIRKGHIHKRGALCAPRQPDELNPFKESDISQFFIVQGRVYRPTELDTMELAINRPIRKRIIKKIFTSEKRAKLKALKEAKDLDAARNLAAKIKQDINTEFKLANGTLIFTKEQREAYTTVGGYPQLDGEYTIFGEMIEGDAIIDKIASLKTDKFDRPFKDVRIKVTVIK